jgi:hypothetical protein
MDVFQPNRLTDKPAEQDKRDPCLPGAKRSSRHLVVMTLGAVIAFLVCFSGGVGTVWGKITGPFSLRPDSEASSAVLSESDLDRQRPQEQAELLLERAVSRSTGAADESEDTIEAQIEAQIEAKIEARTDSWRGQLKWDAQLGDLTTVALNSNDQSVRASAIEVQLAAYGLQKNQRNVDALVRQANSRDRTKKIWALWALGLLGNRGIDTDRVVQVLTAHLKASGKDSDRDRDEDARRWSVQGLALVGTTPTIAPLLDAMRNDPSPAVRERAACSLAQCGMLSHRQRLIAVPQLIDYAGDSTLDTQTRTWAFQALTQITKQRLPNDTAIWRNWYQNHPPED